MVNKLFESFLIDAEQYQACERYWAELISNITKSLGQTGEWARWIPRHYADGTPFDLDGNPIFDGRSEKLNRAFRIIQHPAVGDDIEIAAWIKSYEAEYSDLPRDELVINLSLSEGSAELSRALLQKWMMPETTMSEMMSFIRDNIPRSEQ